MVTARISCGDSYIKAIDVDPPDLFGVEAQRELLKEYFTRFFNPTLPGYLHVATRENRWEERSFHWPDQNVQATEWLLTNDARGQDVFIVPNILESRSRRDGVGVDVRFVHADVDEGKFDAGLVRNLGGIAVASGSPGNAHVYIPLTRHINPTEHRTLSKALKVHLGAKDSKIRENDFLRPPGTHNYKDRQAPREVTFLGSPESTPQEPAQLATLLKVDLPGSNLGGNGGHARTHLTLQVRGDLLDRCDRPRPPHTQDPGQPALQPGYTGLLRTGILIRPSGGRYASRSEALAGAALHSVNLGMGRDDFISTVTRPDFQSSCWRPASRMPDWAGQVWDAAHMKSQTSAPIRSRAEALAFITAAQVQAQRPFPGRSGPIQRAVLSAVHEHALSMGSVELDLSLRDLAMSTGRSLSAVRGAVEFLISDGWIKRTKAGNRSGHAARYRVLQPRHGSLTDSAQPPTTTSAHDYWSCLPASAKDIYDALLHQPGTAREVAARTGISARTVRRQLRGMEADGPVHRDDGSVWQIKPSDLDHLADNHAFAGRLSQRASTFARERAARKMWVGERTGGHSPGEPHTRRLPDGSTTPRRFGTKVTDLPHGEHKNDVV